MSELLEVCKTLLRHCEEHNKDYHHVTPIDTILKARLLIDQHEERERRRETYEQLHD